MNTQRPAHRPRLSRLAVAALLMPLAAAAQPAYPGWGWGMPYEGHMWGGPMGYGGYGWGHALFWLVLVAVGVLVVVLARRGGDRGHPPHRDVTHTALQILNERYARGEIDKAEYEEKKATLLDGHRR